MASVALRRFKLAGPGSTGECNVGMWLLQGGLYDRREGSQADPPDRTQADPASARKLIRCGAAKVIRPSAPKRIPCV